MTSENSAGGDAPVHEHAALQLSRRQRQYLASASFILAVAVGFVAYHFHGASSLPDLLLGVMAVGCLAGAGLSIVGRLPVGFQVAGVALEFNRQQDLPDFIGTMRGQLSDNPDALKSLEASLRGIVGPEVYEKAEGVVRKFGSDGVEAAEAIEVAANPGGTATSIAQSGPVGNLLEGVSDTPPVSGYDVADSGKGKVPRFDYLVTRGNIRAVVEFEHYWNATSVDLVGRKVDRALGEATCIHRAIVLVPSAGVAAYKDRLGSRSDVLVAAFDGEQTEELKAELIDFLETAQSPRSNTSSSSL